MYKDFQSFKMLLKHLGISKATYFRHKKEGRLFVDMVDGAYRLTLQDRKHHQYIQGWIAWNEDGIHRTPWSASYRQKQEFYLGKYLKNYGNTVSSKFLEHWIKSIPPERFSLRKGRHSAVSSFAKYLHFIEQLSDDEHQKIINLFPKIPKDFNYAQRIISQNDLELILKANEVNHRQYQKLLNKTLVIFLSETALRVSEACLLKNEDLYFSVNPAQAHIKIKRGKGGKGRLVPFSKKAQEALQAYLQNKTVRSEWVFMAFNPKHGYTPINRSAVASRFRTIQKYCGIDFSAHSFRHYRITQWANNPRIPITTVQKWAGHNDLVTTQKYIHVSDEEALKAAFE